MLSSVRHTLWIVTGSSVALLLLAGGLLFSEVSYKHQLSLSVGTVAVGVLVTKLWRDHRRATRLSAALQQLAEGELDRPPDEDNQGLAFDSVNTLYHKLREAASFVERLEETALTSEFRYLNPTERLGKALLDVKSTLRTYREDEEQRHWSARGLTHFANVLRGHSDDMQEFSDQVIRQLVQCLGVNQGGLFVKTESEGNTYFERTACYAYDRKKYAEQRWRPGQGLVGQCALEQKMILLTDVPDQYTTITSGLGEATPSVIVIVPLLWNEAVCGVVELASFTPLADHQIDFLERVAENIASSLATVQTNAHMRQLLRNSRQLNKEFEQLSLVANNTDNSVIIADQDGRIEFVNHGFTKLTGYTAAEVIGKKPGRVLQGPDTDAATVQRIRQQLRQGVPFYEEILNYRKNGKRYWISLTVNPIRNEAGVIEQYISIQADVTQIKQQTLDYTHKIEAISRSNAIVEFDPQGTIIGANDRFLDIAGYQQEDLLQKDHTYLLPATEIDSPQTHMMWDSLKAGTFFSGEFKQKSKVGKELWLSGTFNPIFDLEGKLSKIMMFAQFTTHEKEKQHDLTSTVQAFAETLVTFTVSPEGHIKKANSLFQQRFGYRRRELLKMQLSDLTDTNSQVTDLSEASANPRLPITLLTKSGEKVVCQCVLHGVSNLEGTLSKVIVIVREDHLQTVTPPTI